MHESSAIAALRREIDVVHAEFVAEGRGDEFDATVARLRASGEWPFEGRADEDDEARPSSWVIGPMAGPTAGAGRLRLDEDLIGFVRGLDGALILTPAPGSDAPEIAWGDSFFYYAPDGAVPTNVQPYGTVVTKDYPDDAKSRLAAPGRWRVNIHVGRDTFQELLGGLDEPPDEAFAQPDVFLPHPVYAALGWVSVVNPGTRTGDAVLDLLRRAHGAARRRHERRAARDQEV